MAAAAVVAGLGSCLVEASPSGPGQPVSDGVHGVCDQFGEQPADFVEAQRDQLLVGGWGGALVRGDHGQYCVGEHDQSRVPVPRVQRRTWCSSSPTVPLAVWKLVSMRQRVPAMRTRV